MATQTEFTAWRAENWGHLRTIWRDLVGDGMPGHKLRFAGNSVTESQAGYVFQTLIVEGFRLSKADIEPPFDVPMITSGESRTQHQVDGAIFIDWNGFLIESKFTRVDFGPLARLQVLCELRTAGTLGLFFAAKGYTPAALDLVRVVRPARLLLFAAPEIDRAIQGEDFIHAVRVKWRYAVQFGRADVDPIQIEVPEGNKYV